MSATASFNGKSSQNDHIMPGTVSKNASKGVMQLRETESPRLRSKKVRTRLFCQYRFLSVSSRLQRLPRIIKEARVEDFSGRTVAGWDAGVEDGPVGQLRGLE
jgi:hypothetical protein